MMMNRRRFAALCASLPMLSIPAAGEETPAAALNARLEEIRKKHNVPALAAGLVTVDGLRESGFTGMRKAGGSTPVTGGDLWHYGSMTKAMTATLLGTFVLQGRLKWDATLKELLPDLTRRATPQAQGITLRQLLTHRSGLPANRDWSALPEPRDRAEIVRHDLALPLLSEPGSTYLYSNLGYVTAGVVAEKLGGQTWERLLTDRVFKPLKIKAGFGGTGTPGKEDQPWPHGSDGKHTASNGPKVDNPASLGPAGTCHASLADYALFVADHLRGGAGGKALLSAAIYTDLHTTPTGKGYAFGWDQAERDWGGGTVLTHNGSNTMNYSQVWMAPKKGFAVVAACNQGGDAAAKACDDACSLFISRHTG